MGAWGTGPFDNDGAADMMAGLTEPIRLAAERKTNRSASYHYQEARAACCAPKKAEAEKRRAGRPERPLPKRRRVRVRRMRRKGRGK